MARIVISGYYGFDNIGDEAVLLSMIFSFRKLNQDLDIVVLSSSPELTSSRYQVESINRNNFVKIIKEIKKADLFISGGGSLLQDVTGWKSIPYYSGLAYTAVLLNTKTAFYAQGVGPVSGKANKFLVKKTAKKMDYISVRDKKSYDFLVSLGLAAEDINISVDPVFSLKKELSTEKQSAGVIKSKLTGSSVNNNDNDKNKISKYEKPLIGIVVRPWGNNQYISKIAAAAERLVKDIEGQLVVIPMHYQQDMSVSKRFVSLVDGPVKLFEAKNGPAEKIKLFAGLDLLIGVRLHSLIFAALHNVPIVAVSYDPKVWEFLNSCSLNSAVAIEDFDKDALYRISKTVWDNRNQFSSILQARGQLFYQKAMQDAEAVLKLLE
ncbi:MAG: polysaccharide pyruvyl transferase CsaB [Halothermotrichaceae bacterium]